jgi:hypothetical protein
MPLTMHFVDSTSEETQDLEEAQDLEASQDWEETQDSGTDSPTTAPCIPFSMSLGEDLSPPKEHQLLPTMATLDLNSEPPVGEDSLQMGSPQVGAFLPTEPNLCMVLHTLSQASSPLQILSEETLGRISCSSKDQDAESNTLLPSIPRSHTSGALLIEYSQELDESTSCMHSKRSTPMVEETTQQHVEPAHDSFDCILGTSNGA